MQKRKIVPLILGLSTLTLLSFPNIIQAREHPPGRLPLNLVSYCKTMLSKGARPVLVSQDTGELRCVVNRGTSLEIATAIDMSRACQMQYGTTRYGNDTGQPLGWYCETTRVDLDYNRHCQTILGSNAKATLISQDAKGWRCIINQGTPQEITTAIEMSRACQMQYGTTKYGNDNQQADGWYCEL
jgi:hypothetical protein